MNTLRNSLLTLSLLLSGAHGATGDVVIDTMNASGLRKGVLLTPAANHFIGFDASGNLIVQSGGSGSGTVISVTGTGNVNGLTLTGTVTSTGSLTLGGTLSVPIATGVSGLATGVAAFLGTASSANLRAAITDETGAGALYFTGGSLGAPTAGDFSAGSFTWPTFNQNTTGSAATLTTARTINGVSFNGGANVTVPAALATLTGGGNHKVLYLNGSGVPTELALGTAGQVFQSNGPTSAPSFVTPSGGAGSYDMTITSLAGLAAKPTVALPFNTLLTVIINAEMQDWQLISGNNATSTGIQRPNDYNASTNMKVWFRRR
jgi:hypothetical protein